MKNNKNLFIILGVALVVVVFASYFIITGLPSKNSKLIDLTFPISWFHGPQYAYVYVTIDKGFFAEEGLNVTITENQGSAITSQLIASGQVPIGMVGADIAMIARSKGLPLTVVAVADKVNPSGITCFASANVTKPKDLEGKKLGVTITSNSYQSYLAFAKEVNLDLSKIEEIPIGGAGLEWLAGKTDCQVLYPFLSESAAEIKGFNVTSLYFTDYGITMYNQAVVANSNVLKDNPELIHKVARALSKGIAYERAHPDEALAISFKLNPLILSKTDYHTKIFEKRMAMDKKLSDPSTAGDATQDKNVWLQTKDTLNNLKLLQDDVNVDELFTNKFIK